MNYTKKHAIKLLLVCSTVLLITGCQKSKISSNGIYTELGGQIQGRTPASTQVVSQFDPKQIYIYCSINSINSKQCFNQLYNDFVQEQGKNIPLVTDSSEFDKAEVEVNQITNKILDNLQDKIQFYTNKRQAFCQQTSKNYFSKCLSGNAESDTMNILNSYQQAVNKVNGQEYLFLKKKIQQELKRQLASVSH